VWEVEETESLLDRFRLSLLVPYRTTPVVAAEVDQVMVAELFDLSETRNERMDGVGFGTGAGLTA